MTALADDEQIVLARRETWVMLPVTLVADDRLSFAARGMALVIIAHESADDFEDWFDGLDEVLQAEAFTALSELEAHGLLSYDEGGDLLLHYEAGVSR